MSVIIEFDHRSDGGARRVGPFDDRGEAQEWMDRNITAQGVESESVFAPLADPDDTPAERLRLRAREILQELRCVNGRCCEVYPMRDEDRCQYDPTGRHYFDTPGVLAKLEEQAR